MKKYALIGLGEAGAKVVEGFNYDDIDKIVIDSDEECLNSLKNSKTIKVNVEKEDENCKLDKEDEEKILDLIKKYEKIYFYTGVSGATSEILVKEIAKNLNNNHFIIIQLPFNFEGKKRNAKAQDTINFLKKHTENILYVNAPQIGDDWVYNGGYRYDYCNKLKIIKNDLVKQKELI